MMTIATPSHRPGYVYLISVLFVGIIACALAISLLLLATAAERTGLSLQQSAQSLALAQGCAEHGLLKLWQDSNYQGQELLTFGDGTCEILRIGGSGNENRTLCAEAEVGEVARRLEIVIGRLVPSVVIYSWQEVADFNACTY